MSDEAKRQPVETTGLDAGIAAREAAKAAAANANDADNDAEQGEPDGNEAGHDDEGQQAEGEETQNTEESADSEKGGAKPKPRNRGVGKRIDELTKEKHDALREREYWRQEAERQAEQLRQLQQPSKPTDKTAAQADHQGRPTLEQFDFDQDAYAEAVAEWKFNELIQKQESTRKAQERQRSFAEKEAAFLAEHPDYEAVAKAPHVPITQAVAEEILQADNPPAIAYYLGSHLDEAAAIAQMSPAQISRAIGRIEGRLSAPVASESPRQPEPKTVSRAPAPVTTLSGAPAVKKSYDDMSMKEYDEARRKERAAKGLSNR